MPDRYVQDTAKHCTLVTQTQMVAKWVEDRPRWWDWLVPRGDVHDPFINADLGSVSWTYFGDGAQVLFPYSVVPTIPHTLGFTIQDFRDVPFRVSTVETIDGIDRELNSLTIDHVGDYSLDFVPHGGTVNVVWTKAVSSPPTVTLTVLGLHFGHWTYEPGEVYVQLCNSRDPYEFGFNGQMKTNEIAGTGNHNTALFWEYDTRLGRRWNLDPKSIPSESGYATLGDNPVFNIDRLGDVIAPWWLKSGPGDKIPGYGGGVQSPYKSFLPGEHENNPSEKLDDFNRTAIGLYTSNSIFKKTVDMLRASRTVYHVQQRYETDQNGVNAQYSPTTKTIEFKFFGISKEELFEETFHAGQDDYYSARGIKEKRPRR